MIQKRECDSPALSQSFLADVERTMGNLNHAFDPLHKDCLLDYHVSGTKDGYVYLSFALPEGMIRAFVTLLESLHGFFRFVDIKARVSKYETKAIDPEKIQERREFHEQFIEEVCQTFDRFIVEGLDQKTAISATNQALKATNHPWAVYETICSILRKEGRLRKVKTEKGGLKNS